VFVVALVTCNSGPRMKTAIKKLSVQHFQHIQNGRVQIKFTLYPVLMFFI
jgi:hypothetical protein